MAGKYLHSGLTSVPNSHDPFHASRRKCLPIVDDTTLEAHRNAIQDMKKISNS